MIVVVIAVEYGGEAALGPRFEEGAGILQSICKMTGGVDFLHLLPPGFATGKTTPLTSAGGKAFVIVSALNSNLA